jgi:hypothetical protein
MGTRHSYWILTGTSFTLWWTFEGKRLGQRSGNKKDGKRIEQRGGHIKGKGEQRGEHLKGKDYDSEVDT